MPIKPLRNLTLEQNLARITFQSSPTLAKAIEQQATWLVVGIAVVLGAIISNMDPISDAVDRPWLRWGIVLLTISLILGSAAKQMGASVIAGFVNVDALREFFETPEAQAMTVAIDPDKLKREIREGYLFPLSLLALKGFDGGTRNQLHGEIMLTRMLCRQTYTSWLQALFAAAGIVSLAAGLK